MCKYSSEIYPKCPHNLYYRTEQCEYSKTNKYAWDMCPYRFFYARDQNLPAPEGRTSCPMCAGPLREWNTICQPRDLRHPGDHPFVAEGFFENGAKPGWFSIANQGVTDDCPKGFFTVHNFPLKKEDRRPEGWRGEALKGLPSPSSG
jgi:hypothetical protein